MKAATAKSARIVTTLFRVLVKASSTVIYRVRNGEDREYIVTLSPNGHTGCTACATDQACPSSKGGRKCYHIKHCVAAEQSRVTASYHGHDADGANAEHAMAKVQRVATAAALDVSMVVYLQGLRAVEVATPTELRAVDEEKSPAVEEKPDFSALHALTVGDYQKWLRGQIRALGRRAELGTARLAPIEVFVKEATGFDFKLCAGGEIEVYVGATRYEFFTQAGDLAYYLYDDETGNLIIKAGKALDMALLEDALALLVPTNGPESAQNCPNSAPSVPQVTIAPCGAIGRKFEVVGGKLKKSA